ncbi:MAG: DUF6262 family protein [Actinomycetota bacterium]|nr:DUF6262 family protein [Actinomycetota bacterium]
MNREPSADSRVAGLKAARSADSQAKRQRVLAAIDSLSSAGAVITFPSVAQTAGVSTWLVYAEGVREHVEAARARQTTISTRQTPCSTTLDRPRASPAGLRADLAFARAEIARLRAEADKLRKRLQLHLGAEIDRPDRAELIARVAELESLNRQLVAERDSRSSEADAARLQVVELQDELVAARESLRRAIRANNRAR